MTEENPGENHGYQDAAGARHELELWVHQQLERHREACMSPEGCSHLYQILAEGVSVILPSFSKSCFVPYLESLDTLLYIMKGKI